MTGFMLDSNVIDYLVDNNVDLTRARAVGPLYITSIQRSEILNVPNEERREELVTALELLALTVIPVSPPVWLDSMRWDDDAIWRDGPSGLESAIYGNASKAERWQDAAIGAVAQENESVLVTSDGLFRKRAEQVGIQTMRPEQLFSF